MLILDANILIRAVLGSIVLSLIRTFGRYVEFVAPDIAFHEAREHLPLILQRRGIPVGPAAASLEALGTIVKIASPATYSGFERAARLRLRGRDEDDWPILALALALGCPIWTEDTDFFGCGVATWTTGRVEIYLADPANHQSN